MSLRWSNWRGLRFNSRDKVRTFGIYKQLMSLIFSFNLIACTTQQKNDESERLKKEEAMEEARKTFEKATRFLDRERFDDAREILEGLVKDKPVTELDLIVLFNLGFAYEGLGDCKKAGQRYRQVISMTNRRPSPLFGQALLRLSYAYECVGATELAISTLKRAEALDEEILPLTVLKSEIPARLASHYAQLGQRKEALRYFQLADDGIIELQKAMRKKTDLIDQITRAYYLMGRVHVRQGRAITAKAYFEALQLQQTFLLRSAELSENKWSKLASQELKIVYDRVDSLVKEEKDQNANLSMRERRQLERDWIERALVSLEKVKALKLPSEEQSPHIENVFQFLDEKKIHFQAQLALLASDTEKTNEALELEKLKKEVKFQ